MRTPGRIALACVTAVAASALGAGAAYACGCFAPPVPEGLEDFAVNQEAEQIIFEVPEPGTVVAHVLIKYAGSPEEFAWIIPAPNPPQLALSETLAFVLLDAATRPDVSVVTRDICPRSPYLCRYHPPLWCPGDWAGVPTDASSGADTAASPDAGANGPPPGGVTIIDQQVIGSYDTITFSAEDAGLAVGWLNDNGFIVNETTTPFMQSYIDAGMVFVAAKLVAGAGVEEIKPLKMTYQHDGPIIPLKLTAVAAEPHLTITSWIYANEAYRPKGHSLASVPSEAISRDAAGRVNYPMVMSRVIDEAGGDGFVAEYVGTTPPGWRADDTGCCDSFDWCGVGFDGLCQCPGSDIDADDCAVAGLTEGIGLLDELATKYSKLTRLTTRVSPHEMSFDPVFEPSPTDLGLNGRLRLIGERFSLDACAADAVTVAELATANAALACSSIYCGKGECVAMSNGAGCRCDADYVARTFNDLDGLPSVTCVPAAHVVDLGVGIELPSACAGLTLPNGLCVDLGGFAAADCGAGFAGRVDGANPAPACLPIENGTGSPGGQNFSTELKTVKVCRPRPPSCGPEGWLDDQGTREGEDCGNWEATTAQLTPPPAPECPDEDTGGNATDAASNDGGPAGSDTTVPPGQDGSSDAPGPTVTADPNAAEDSSEDDGCSGGPGLPGAPLTLGFAALLVAGLAYRRRQTARA